MIVEAGGPHGMPRVDEKKPEIPTASSGSGIVTAFEWPYSDRYNYRVYQGCYFISL